MANEGFPRYVGGFGDEHTGAYGNIDESPDFRRGDEEPDARMDGFDVYGGSPADRASLQDADPALLDDLRRELGDTLGGFSKEMDRGIGRTPFDDMRDEIEGV